MPSAPIAVRCTNSKQAKQSATATELRLVTMSVPTLTIAVLTKNEAHRIEACLASAAFADQVVVVDSGSTDNTVALSRQAGAEVFEYPDWQGFAVQRNRLISHAKCDYIFFLDADELITPAFQKELQAIVQSNAQAVWQIQWRMVAYGHELTYYISRSKVERLFRRDMLKEYVGAVHEQAILHNENPANPVPRKVISAKLLHHSRETVRGSLEKLTQYVMLGASKRAQAGKRGGVVRGLASGLSMFVRLYVFRLGFLCGGAGFLYCLFVALEAFFRYAALHYDKDHLTNNVGRA
jgi:glycosyltransferase involved in cell wall biosynthesis